METLGVWSYPAGMNNEQLQKIEFKGIDQSHTTKQVHEQSLGDGDDLKIQDYQGKYM